MKRLIGMAAVSALCLGFAAPALAIGKQQEAKAIAFALNNSVWVLYHEVGHLFVDQFQLPVLGAREEDAADALATLVLLQQETEDAEQALRDSVDGWFMSDIAVSKEDYDKADFYDPHALDIVRAYGMVCLMVGKHYVDYRPLAGEIGMDRDRIADCEYDYELASRSWSATLKPHLNAGDAGATINVVYDDAPGSLAKYGEMIRDDRLLERAADRVMSDYALKRPVTFRAMTCDDANAFYDADLNEIQLCYEYVQFYYDLKAAELALAGDAGSEDSGDVGGGETGADARDKIDN